MSQSTSRYRSTAWSCIIKIIEKILNMVDTGTTYGERVISPSKEAENLKDLIETLWLYKHVTTERFSEDLVF